LAATNQAYRFGKMSDTPAVIINVVWLVFLTAPSLGLSALRKKQGRSSQSQ